MLVGRPNDDDRRLPTGWPKFTRLVTLNASTKPSIRQCCSFTNFDTRVSTATYGSPMALLRGRFPTRPVKPAKYVALLRGSPPGTTRSGLSLMLVSALLSTPVVMVHGRPDRACTRPATCTPPGKVHVVCAATWTLPGGVQVAGL